MSLVGENVSVGDRVQVIQTMPQQYRLNTNERHDLNPSEVFVVTRVNTTNLNIRGPKTVRDPQWPHNDRLKDVSFSVDRTLLRFEDPDYVPPPPPRTLGVMPEGEGLISIDDPGIQWLFDDMGRFAEEQGYCSQYDALCVRLGIPGRPREFKVRHTVAGIELMANVRARSQREANEHVRAALEGRVPDMELDSPLAEPDFTPAA